MAQARKYGDYLSTWRNQIIKRGGGIEGKIAKM